MVNGGLYRCRMIPISSSDARQKVSISRGARCPCKIRVCNGCYTSAVEVAGEPNVIAGLGTHHVPRIRHLPRPGAGSHQEEAKP